MKNLLILLTALFLIPLGISAQSVPSGMRFQAIARSLDGSLMTDKSVFVQVEIYTTEDKENVFYTETHEIKSNTLGLLDFVIGEGTPVAGTFSTIPWSKSEMWVRVSMKLPGDDNFQIVSTGQLYSVPYAQHADVAGKVISNQPGGNEGGNRGQGGDLDQTAIFWALDGNLNSHKYKGGGPAVLGTTDRVNLTFITNGIPRMVIDAQGNVTIYFNFTLAGDLVVNGNTTLNGSLDVTTMKPTHFTGTLRVDKVTQLNDALTIQNMAPSMLTGDLTVGKTLEVKEATVLQSSLDVTGMNATHFTGIVGVDLATVLNSSLTVTNLSPTQLTGSLDVDKTMNVDGATTLNNAVDVFGVSHLTGTLVVEKATTMNSNLTVTNLSPTNLTGTLDVDKTMNVDGATTLNGALNGTSGSSASHLTGTLVADKASTVGGNLTVANTSATSLTGTLDVDKTMNIDETSTLNDGLDVTNMSATHLAGTLTIDKQAIINAALTVMNASLTHFTGSLDVDGDIHINGAIGLSGPLDVVNMNPSSLTGTLDVDKMATFKAGLYVEGKGLVGPGGDDLAFFDNTEGGSSDGIAIKVANSHPNKETNYMTFYEGSQNVARTTGRIEGYQISDIADVPVPTGDEIWTAVCIGLADYNPLTIAWTHMATAFNFVSDAWNNETIPAFDIPDIPAFNIPDVPALAIPDVPAFNIPDVPSFVIPDVPGVVIPDVPSLEIGPYLCANICFCDCCAFCFDFSCCCESVCLVPHFTLFPGLTIPDFPGIGIPDFPGIAIPDFPGIPIPDFPGIAIPNFPGLVIPAVPEFKLGTVVGHAPTIPTLNDILVQQGVCPNVDIFNLDHGYVRKLVDWAIEHRLHNLISLDPIKLLAAVATWGLTSYVLNDGVVYGSKGADYAEYLPKMYASEQFMPGDIIGVYNGKISKNTRNADMIMAITSQPIVLGNMPDASEENQFEKVAFLGQIPVYVQGPVKTGDYILPSGKNNGIAVAVSPKDLSTEMLSLVLGQAWSENTNESITMINTSIGLRPMEISEALKRQSQMEEELTSRMEFQLTGIKLMNNDVEKMKEKLGLSATTSNP